MLEAISNLRKPAKNKMRRANWVNIVLWLLAFIPLMAWSQVDSLATKKQTTDCEASLALANGEFNAGRFFSLPSILKKCLDNGFTKEQKVRAYILLCQVYLINDNPSEAENSYLELLKADPEYIATPEKDPIDVVYLSQKFTTRPVFTPHFKIGINTSFVSVIHSSDQPDNGTSSYGLKPGYCFGGGLDWNMSDRLSLSADLVFSNRAFVKTTENIFGRDTKEQIARLSWIDIPFYLKFQDYKGIFRPYGYAGYAIHVSVLAKGKYSYFNIDPQGSEGEVSQFPTQGSDVVFTKNQNLLNQSLVFGGGMKYKWGKNYLFADLRMQLGLSNVTDPSKIITSSDGTINSDAIKYTIINDLYRLNSITLSFGYIIPVYNPRKKGGWEPKGLLGKILYGNKKEVK